MLRFRSICRLVYRRASSDVSHFSRKPLESISPFSTASSSSIRKKGRFFKYGSLGALAFTGYVTCAYTTLELDLKTRDFRDYALNNSIFSERYRKSKAAVTPMSFSESDNSDVNPTLESANRDVNPTLHSTPGFNSAIMPWVMAVPALFMQIYVSTRYMIEDLVEDNLKPPPDKLLPDTDPITDKFPVYTLVLDLTETLVHCDWKHESLEGPGGISKRPGLEAFLKHVYALGYEVVLYTDELRLFLYDFEESLDRVNFISLSKGSTVYQDGKRYRDLSRLNRDPSRILYVSAHALDNCLQPENCVPIRQWKKELDDTTLTDLLPFLEGNCRVRETNDIRSILSLFKEVDIPTRYKQIREAEERRREKFARRRGWFCIFDHAGVLIERV